MIFSSTEIERAGMDAYINGLQRNRNPYINKQEFINSKKLRVWYYGYDKAENDCNHV